MILCHALKGTIRSAGKGSDGLRAGKIAGVQLVLNNWFIVVGILFAVAGLLNKLLIVFAAVACHETAHAVVAAALGMKVREVAILPFGGVARIEGLGETKPSTDLLIASAGPVCSVMLAGLTWLALLEWPDYNGYGLFFLQVNWMLAAFNLLPALPLDGGRILRALLAAVWDYNQATAVASRLSKAIGLGLLLWAGLTFIRAGEANITVIAAGIFVYAAARAETVKAGFRVMKTLSSKKELLMMRGILPTVHYTASDHLTIKEVIRLFQAEHYHVIHVIDEDLCVTGIVTEKQLWDALTQKGLYTPLGTILKGNS